MLQKPFFWNFPVATSLFLTILFPFAVQANCGLQSCPRPAHESDASTWQAEVRTRWVAFDADSVSGSYTVLSTRLLWRPFSRWTVGVEVPVTRLDAGDEVHTGLSNPLLTALYGRRFSETWSGEAGMQLELPFGETDHSLADDHVMLLPWIGVRRDLGDAWQMSGLLGVSHAIETGSAAVADISAPALAKSAALSKTAHNGVDHGAGAAPVYVNPHGDREIQWRLGLSRVWNRSTAEVFALGQSDISEGISHAEYYARAGLSWDLALTHILGLQTLAHVPVTSARRSEAELGLSVRAAW